MTLLTVLCILESPSGKRSSSNSMAKSTRGHTSLDALKEVVKVLQVR